MNLESAYRLSKAKNDEGVVARRAKLYDKAPVKEMVRRGWIEASSSIDVLERRVRDFFGISTLDEEPQFWPYAARKSSAFSNYTRAWLFRARHLAPAVRVKRFGPAKIKDALDALRPLLHATEEARHVSRVLAEAGIRFLVMEHLPQTRIDGACFWLDETSPVIVLSLRYDRIDWFWHTLIHEIRHVERRHGLEQGWPVDVDLFARRTGAKVDGEDADTEREANEFAARALIPREELDDFVARVGPLYSQKKIRGFAGRLRVHPGIVVGQLQFQGKLDYSLHRRMLAPLRDIVTQATLTDGWGHNVPASA